MHATNNQEYQLTLTQGRTLNLPSVVLKGLSSPWAVAVIFTTSLPTSASQATSTSCSVPKAPLRPLRRPPRGTKVLSDRHESSCSALELASI